jgi:hypothetical protein
MRNVHKAKQHQHDTNGSALQTNRNLHTSYPLRPQPHHFDQQKSVAEIQRGASTPGERPFASQCGIHRSVNVPLLERRTHVPNQCSDHLIKVPSKCVRLNVNQVHLQRGFSHQICEGERDDRQPLLAISALGQKQTLKRFNPMSALPPESRHQNLACVTCNSSGTLAMFAGNPDHGGGKRRVLGRNFGTSGSTMGADIVYGSQVP